MAGNIQNVSFSSPQALLAPDLVAQQQANEQQLALAQALREQSLGEIKVDPGSKISWTQGAAKLAQALAAKHGFNKANAQTGNLAKQYGSALSGMFGGAQAPTAVQQAQAIDGNPGIGAQQSIPNPTYGSGGVDDPGGQSPTMPSPQQQAPAPQPQGQQKGGTFAPGPMSLTGDPNRDRAMYAMAPEEYTKGVVAAAAPTELSRMMAQAGIDPHSSLGRQILQQSIAKQNYVAPIEGRGGTTQRDPFTNQVTGYNATPIEGAVPTYGADGMPTGYQQIPGGAGAIASRASAEAGGKAVYDPQQVFDPNTGAPVFSTRAQVAQAAQGGNPMQAGPGLGASAAADVTGKNSANAFQDISNGAADVPNRLLALHNMQGLVADPRSQFGVGSEGLNHFNGLLNTVGQSVGIPIPAGATTNANEFNKWATQYSARSGQELGLSGSDARTQLAVHATPNGEMTKEALQSVIPQMVGLETAKQGYAVAANQWQQTHGPQTVQQFRTEWNKVYDPAIYTHIAQGPQAFAGWVKGLTPAQASAARSKYVTLKQIGALPQ